MHLAEAAQVLTHNVQYEIPALRKVVQGCQRQRTELHRKEGEYKRVSADYAGAYEKECAKLGIKGGEVKAELLERSRELPNMYASLVEVVRGADMSLAREVYEAFVRFSGASAGNRPLPLIRGMQEGEVPSREEMERIAFADDAVSFEDMSTMLGGGGCDIDWGDDGGAGAGGGSIDWGGAETGGGHVGIDWGDAGGGAVAGGDGVDWGDSGGAEGARDGDGIDWGGAGGEASGGGEIDWGADVGIEVEGGGEEGVEELAGGAECLKSAEGRAKLVNELMEVHSFLKMRLEEAHSTDYMAVDTSADLPAVCQANNNAEKLGKLASSCQDAISLLNSPLTQQLIMLRSSSRFLNRLTTSLEVRLQNSTRMAGCIAGCLRRRLELDEQIAGTQPKIEALSKTTRSVKECAEELLTEMMLGRRVSVIGDINTVCGA